MVRRETFTGVAKVVLLFLILMATALLVNVFFNDEPAINTNGDLNDDGVQETYTLVDHRLTVIEGSVKLWTSPKEYRIDSFSLDDVDNDGTMNLVLSLWKRGSFGEMKPFWHTGKDDDYKNHLFVYRLEDRKFKQIWCSSNLDHPIVCFEIADVDDDELNELVVTEGQYKKKFGSKYEQDPEAKKRTVIWEWNEWGFQRKSSSMEP